MNLTEYCIDTNIIITHLFEIEPHHILINNFISKYYNKIYYTYHIKNEVNKVVEKKIKIINEFLHDSIPLLNNLLKEYIDFNEFSNHILKFNKKEYFYHNQPLKKYTKKNILKNF